VDAEGNEIDRIVGFRPPAEYLVELTRIRNGINTLPDLIQRLETEPDNADILISLAKKLEVSSGLQAAIGYWDALFKLESADAVSHSLAALKIALFHAQETNNPETLLAFINTETNTDVLPEAFDALRNFYRRLQDKPAEANTYRRYVDFMSGVNRLTPEFLNGYAWRMTQLNLNLDNALERVQQALDLLPDKAEARERAQIMDTKAEVLWKQTNIDTAVQVIEACILLQPEDSYYQKQKDKFLSNKTVSD